MTAQLPQGTVTFLFTDIEGSTQLWERHPEAMQAALARHDALLRQLVEANHGTVIKTTGDGLHAVFASAAEAASAVLAGQRREYDAAVAQLRGQTEPATVEAAWGRGRALALEEAVQYALVISLDDHIAA